jgi:diadenosine tetraphosphatase ApaH/serine/threonine PP2A family protein phosphatase
MMAGNYDLIGDIHGHAEVLRRLLKEMNYRDDDGVFRHPSRQVIFVGDFVDRGPEQREVLEIAKSTCAAGAALAVMGNHEFNALGWAQLDGNGGFLRPHSQNNREQHEEFLRQVGEGSAAHREALEWFQTLPVWLEVPGIRVVHACWHASSQETLRPYLDQSNRFTKGGLREASRRGSEAYDAAEILLKGPEALLPDGRSFSDKQGHLRHEVRLGWWDPGATTLRTAALGMDGIEENLPDLPVTTDYHYDEKIPVFFGHYWLRGTPIISGSYAACLDFSVAKNGFLTAYRWSGESALLPKNVVYVKARSES